MKTLSAVLTLVACNNAQHPSEPVKTTTRNSAPVELSDPERIARWHALAPTGATYADVVDRIPVADRPAMAFALVREGNTTCTRTGRECGFEYVAGPEDNEGIDAPCLRRAVVQRVIAGTDHLTIPADVLATLAKSHDGDLIQTVARVLDDAVFVDFLVAVEAAGTPSPAGVFLKRPRAVIADGVRRHVDAAISELATFEDRDRELVIAAIADQQIAPDTRADMMIGFEPKAASEPLLAALRAAAAEPSCALSARASEVLAALGDRSALPRPPDRRDVAGFFHQACRLTAGQFWDDWHTLASAFVAKRGLVVDAPKGEEFVESREPVRHTFTGEDADLIVLLRRLSSSKCTEKSCIGESARFDLAWSDNKLAKVTIHRDFAKEKIVMDRAAADACNAGGGD